MNTVERFVYDILKKHPALKMKIRDVYQRLFDLLPVQKVWSKQPVTEREGYFFGFHDHSPFSADNGKLLANKFDIPLKMPGNGDQLEIGFFSGPNWTTFTPLQKTSAWNWHQGCKLQWRGNLNECVYNDHVDGKTFARVYNTDSGVMHNLPEAISSISGDGRYAVGYSFARVERYMPGYGYQHETGEPDLEKPVTSNSGIYTVDLETDKVRELISIAEVSRLEYQMSMDGAFHFFSHALFSPTGRRFVFLHRWIKGDPRNRFSRMISMDVEGNGLHIFPPQEMVSHLGWKNNREILAYCRIKNKDAYYLFKDQSDTFKIIGSGDFRSDGHPSFSPDERFIITDTYPDRTRRMSLLKYDIEERKLEKLACLFHPPMYQSSNPYENWRCDLHPRWDRTGRYVCFDSVHTGMRSLCTMQA